MKPEQPGRHFRELDVSQAAWQQYIDKDFFTDKFMGELSQWCYAMMTSP